jgi:hypothetical protein
MNFKLRLYVTTGSQIKEIKKALNDMYCSGCRMGLKDGE